MKTTKYLFTLCLIFTALFVTAQQEKGDKIFRFNGSFQKTGDADGYVMANVKLGYFFTKSVEAGVEPTLIMGSGFSMALFSFYGTYNFVLGDAKFVPYAGVSGGVSAFSIEMPNPTTGATEKQKTNSFKPGGYAGVRYYISENVNVDTGISYLIGKTNDSTFTWNIGLGVIIGRK